MVWRSARGTYDQIFEVHASNHPAQNCVVVYRTYLNGTGKVYTWEASGEPFDDFVTPSRAIYQFFDPVGDKNWFDLGQIPDAPLVPLLSMVSSHVQQTWTSNLMRTCLSPRLNIKNWS
jgi:hypothetical protein